MFKGLNTNDPFTKLMIYLAEARMGNTDAKGILQEIAKGFKKDKRKGHKAFAKFIESQL